nr:MAG TPA: hypothetical protein [Caudoviricetes sp.]
MPCNGYSLMPSRSLLMHPKWSFVPHFEESYIRH